MKTSRSCLLIVAFVTSVVSLSTPSHAGVPTACTQTPVVNPVVLHALQTTELNQHVNAGYAKFAQCFQAIVEGKQSDEAVTGEAIPNWFALAPYASRGVGAAEHALIGTRTLLKRDTLSLLEDFFLGRSKNRKVMAERLAAAARSAPKSGNAHSLINFKVFDSTAHCISQLPNPHHVSTYQWLQMATKTMIEMLEDGNRRIYQNIAQSASKYVAWRSAQPQVTADWVMTQFADAMHADRGKVKTLVDTMKAQPESAANTSFIPALATKIGPIACKEEAVSAFAFFELASTSAGAQRNAFIANANHLLAHCEQFEVVQSAFAPSKPIPHEISRPAITRCLTPTIQLVVRNASWTYEAFANREKIDLTKKNWGSFADRWVAILDSFRTVYATPRAPWPMPNPDASRAP